MEPHDESILGYLDRWSASEGDTLLLHVDTIADRFEVSLRRFLDGPVADVRHARDVAVDGAPTWLCEGRQQHTRIGSYAVADRLPALPVGDGLTMQLWLWPTTPAAGRRQQLIALSTTAGSLEPSLGIDVMGHLEVTIGAKTHRLDKPLLPREWYFVWLGLDARAGTVTIGQTAVSASLRSRTAQLRATFDGACELGSSAVYFAGRPCGATGDARHCFNGKLESPRIWRTPLPTEDLQALSRGCDPRTVAPTALVAAWDFGREHDSARLIDVGPHGVHARTVGCPTRGVTGHNWTGAEVDHRFAAEEYGAVHFHDDDLEDAGWSHPAEIVLPRGLASGIYGLRLSDSREGHDTVPFVVTPRPGGPTADVLLVLPTYTYLAYANMHYSEEHRARLARIDDGTPRALEGHDLRIASNPKLGLSLYDEHSDGSIACYSSARRPVLNFRADYRNWLTGAPRHFSADLLIAGWLQRGGRPFDVITDAELHHRGRGALEDYRVVMTGSHPEYCTRQMWEALEGFVGSGGRLMYLGGNGFYWVTSVAPEQPHIIEVRRGHAGSRPGNTPPGEGYHSTTGEPGGLWRYRGRAPQRLVGVGFTAAGFVGGAGYEQSQAAREPAAFAFEGIAPDEVIGEFGPLGGAAADELDRADMSLGTSPDALVLATSRGRHTDHYQGALEDTPEMSPAQGGTTNPNVRADIVLTQFPSGGATFAIGSIAWSLAMRANGDDNNVSRMTGNVLDRLAGRDAANESHRGARRSHGEWERV